MRDREIKQGKGIDFRRWTDLTKQLIKVLILQITVSE